MSPESRALLELVRDAEDPSPDDQARVLAAVRSAVVAGTAAGVATSAAKSSKLMGSLGASPVKLGVVVIGLTGGAWLIGTKEPARPDARRSAHSTSPAISAGIPPRKASPPPPVPAPAMAVHSAAPNEPALASSPSRRAPREQPAPTVAAPPSLREEIALLADVQRALDRNDGATALGLLERHVTTDRQLAAERAAARIHALCALGRVDEARGAALEFVRAHPSSLQRPAVERSCGGTNRRGER